MKQLPTIKIVEAKLDLLNFEFQVQIWLLRWQDIIFSELGKPSIVKKKIFVKSPHKMVPPLPPPPFYEVPIYFFRNFFFNEKRMMWKGV